MITVSKIDADKDISVYKPFYVHIEITRSHVVCPMLRQVPTLMSSIRSFVDFYYIHLALTHPISNIPLPVQLPIHDHRSPYCAFIALVC